LYFFLLFTRQQAICCGAAEITGPQGAFAGRSIAASAHKLPELFLSRTGYPARRPSGPRAGRIHDRIMTLLLLIIILILLFGGGGGYYGYRRGYYGGRGHSLIWLIVLIVLLVLLFGHSGARV
jgi:hypothetical protein